MLSNLGLVCEFKGNGLKSLEVADQLARMQSDDPAVIQKRAVVRLSQGHLVMGWADYRARFLPTRFTKAGMWAFPNRCAGLDLGIGPGISPQHGALSATQWLPES